jgi:hypothetical protein
VGYFIDQFITEVGDRKQEFVSREEIIGWLGDVNDDILMNVAKPFSWLATRTAYTRTASQGYLDYPTDSNGEITMWKFDRLRHYNIDETEWETLTAIPIEEYEITYADTSVENDAIKHVALDEASDKLRIGPIPETTQVAGLYLYYWAKMTALDSEGDRFQTPTQKVYKSYCLSKFYRKKQVKDSSFKIIADDYAREYASDKFKLKGADRRDQGSPRSMAPPQDHKGYRSYD